MKAWHLSKKGETWAVETVLLSTGDVDRRLRRSIRNDVANLLEHATAERSDAETWGSVSG